MTHAKALDVAGVARDLADYMQKDNPNFRRSLFYTACGLTPDGKVYHRSECGGLE